MSIPGLPCLLTAAACFSPASLHAQAPVTLVPEFAGDEWLQARSVVVFRLEGVAAIEDPEIAAVIGQTDITAFLERDGSVFRYDPRIAPLPPGEAELTVYRVEHSGIWTEVGRAPMRVLTPGGFERISYDPRLAVDNAGQLAESHSDDQLAPVRDTYQDFTFRVGWDTEHVRPGLTVRSQLNTVGVTNREQALQFGLEQEEAPRFDLADFMFAAGGDWTTLSVGHVVAGANRHLVDGLSSRGVTLEVRAERASAKLAAMNGASIVGWSNPLGLTDSRHRILSGEIGVDMVMSRPGALRVDATFVNGSVLPQTSFNQEAIVDAEESRGLGVQLSAALPSGRIRLNGGYAKSRYDDVEDLALSRGLALVEIKKDTRDARHLDVSVDLLPGIQLGESTVANLSTTVRHERVDPLYRSVASFAQSDLEENAVDLTGSIGPLSARYAHSRRSDNLDDIPSILTTLTRSHQLSVTMPAGVILGNAAGPWAPQLSYTLNRIHQFGEGVPQNGGFDETHVPDQLSSVHGVSAQWFHSVLQLGYRFDRSTQDNRQEGREDADFERTTHTVTVGMSPLSVLTLSVDGSHEEALSVAADQATTSRRLALNANWRVASRTALTAFGSQAWATDPFDVKLEREVRQIRLELSQGLSLGGTQGARTGQFFVRFARQEGDLFGLVAEGETPVTWTVNTGFNLTLF